MKRVFKSKRAARLQLAVAATSAGIGLFSAVHVRAAAPLFDNLTSLETGVTDPGNPYAPYYLFYTTANPNATPPENALTDSFEGGAYNLAAGTTSLTGIDLYFTNSTNDPSLSAYPQYNGGAGTTYDDIRVNIYIWGNVTPTPALNSSNPALNSSNPAFSSLIKEVTIDAGGPLPVGGYAFENQNADGVIPGLQFPSPVALNGATTIGVTYNIQGSTDGGNSYQNVGGLTSDIAVFTPPAVGSQQTDTFYLNTSGETNGNYIEGPYHFSYNNSGTITTIPDQGIAARIYGNGPGKTYTWIDPNGGGYSDNTQWSPQGYPGGNDTVVFNLGSTTPYAVEVVDSETANNFYVQHDNVAVNLDAQDSYLYIQNALIVGQAATGVTANQGSLTLENTTDVSPTILEANSVILGGNSGTGTLTVTSQAYLFTDNATTINAGSKLIVQTFGKFDTDTLTIAGTTGAWTGQLDIGFDSTAIFDGNLATVTNQIKSGYNKGAWNGQGIISGAAAADTTHLTAVGVILNNDGNGNPIYSNTSSGALGAFDGENPPTTAVLLRYTYYGDANLDGTVDGSDYSLTDNGFLNHLTGWYNGDFNYDGVVNGSDYTLLDNAFNQQYGVVFQDLYDSPGVADLVQEHGLAHDSSQIVRLNDGYQLTDPTAGVTAEIAAPSPVVPEPATLGLAAMAAVAMLGRRSRRRVS